MRPAVAPYRAAPLPAIRPYRPITGLETPTRYTYTTGGQQAQARAAYAQRATQVSRQAADRSVEAAEDAEDEDQSSGGMMKIAIGIAIVGGTIWFIKKRKKGTKKSTAKKSSTASAFA